MTILNHLTTVCTLRKVTHLLYKLILSLFVFCLSDQFRLAIFICNNRNIRYVRFVRSVYCYDVNSIDTTRKHMIPYAILSRANMNPIILLGEL